MYQLQFLLWILYCIQIYLIMRNRNKFDWSKPFKFIDNKKSFDELDVNDESLVIVINADEQKQPAPHKKEEILVPKIDQVKRVTEVKKFAKITPNYIRLHPHLNLPSPHNYQLTQVDHVFLKSHQDRFIFKGKKLLNQQFLKKVFIELEMKAGKDMTLPRSKGWIMSFLQREYKDIFQTENVEVFADSVYNFWKNRREQLRFPLLRLLWKPNPDEYNHMLAFRPRERQKRSLRRTNRIQEDDIIEELNQEFGLILKIVNRVQARQQLKLRQVQIQLSSFYAQCKNFISIPDIIDQFKLEERAKDRQKFKGYQLQMENYRSQKQSLETIVVQQVVTNDIDQKHTIVNFLASVVYQAQQLSISYQKIYYPNNSLVLERIKSIPQTTIIPQQIIQQKIQEQQRNPQNLINVSLYKYNNMLIRDLEEQQFPIIHIKPCKDYLEYKRRKVDKYYFGSDDQGQIKDVRKNTASSFKKFMQMQHLTKAISNFSAISEN